jgi:hypothetical protein
MMRCMHQPSVEGQTVLLEVDYQNKQGEETSFPLALLYSSRLSLILISVYHHLLRGSQRDTVKPRKRGLFPHDGAHTAPAAWGQNLSARALVIWPLMGTGSAWCTPKQATNLPKSMQKGQGRAHCTNRAPHFTAVWARQIMAWRCIYACKNKIWELFKGGAIGEGARSWVDDPLTWARSWVDDPLTWRSSRMDVSCWIKTRGARSLILLQASRNKICRLLTNRVSIAVDVSDQHCYPLKMSWYREYNEKNLQLRRKTEKCSRFQFVKRGHNPQPWTIVKHRQYWSYQNSVGRQGPNIPLPAWSPISSYSD